MKENIIQEKSYKFAIRTVNLYKYLVKDKKEFLLNLDKYYQNNIIIIYEYYNFTNSYD